MAAHLAELRHRLLEAYDHRRFRGAPLVLALVLVEHLDHALECQDAVERRRRRIDAPGKTFDGRKHRGEHRLVDPHHRSYALARDRERAVDRAAREHLRRAVAHRRLDRIPARRQAQPQIKPLGIDRFHLPGPRMGARDAVAARKAGHARQRHRLWPALRVESGKGDSVRATLA